VSWADLFRPGAVTPAEAGLDLDKLQDALERIAGALERIERRLDELSRMEEERAGDKKSRQKRRVLRKAQVKQQY